MRVRAEPRLRLVDHVRAILSATSQPLGVREIVGRIAARKISRPYPNSVYRTLSVLISDHLVMRVVSRRGYLWRTLAPSQHALLLICHGCGDARQIASEPLLQQVHELAKGCRFKVLDVHLEVEGICRRCITANVE